MLRWSILSFLVLGSMGFAFAQDHSGDRNSNCTFNDLYLAGHVRIVEYNADLNVYIDTLNRISPFEVELTDTPSACGQWRIVKYNADFSIRIMPYESGSELIIRFKENQKSKKLLRRLFH